MLFCSPPGLAIVQFSPLYNEKGQLLMLPVKKILLLNAPKMIISNLSYKHILDIILCLYRGSHDCSVAAPEIS
jgi:hypothetical protein